MLLRLILILSVLTALNSNASGQLFLQLERYNNPASIKFYIDQTLEFRLKAYPKTWRKERIIDLIPEEQLVVFEDSYYHIDEFKDIRRRFKTVKTLGERLMQFSAAWFVYGAVATLASDGYTMSNREIILGGSVATIGLLLRDVFSKKKIKLTKKRRLRVMDTRFDPRRGF